MGLVLLCCVSWRAVLCVQGLIRHFRPEMEERIGRFCEQIAA